jgi:hypothetical protein
LENPAKKMRNHKIYPRKIKGCDHNKKKHRKGGKEGLLAIRPLDIGKLIPYPFKEIYDPLP